MRRASLFLQRKLGFPKPQNPDHGPYANKLALERSPNNPIIAPIGDSAWESWQTFNPAAIELDGNVYLFYRAIGDDQMSRVGLAISEDGFTVNERLEEPIFSYQGMTDTRIKTSSGYKRGQFASGGGEWGWAEDPRVTLLGDRIYMFFVAYDGYSEPRLALTTIHVDDFRERVWRWSECRIVSEPGMVNKSGALLPEKIDGKYVIMHRIFPDIQIDIVDDISTLGSCGNFLQTKKLVKTRARQYWDSRKIGAGPPPLKTPYWWLLVYYATDDKDASSYRVGIMLLDLKDPSHVLYRSPLSVLDPEFWYENAGHKAGIVYPCGAVIKDEKLFVYYGGADSYVAVASIDIHRLYHLFQFAISRGCNPLPQTLLNSPA